ncbi:ABC transporter permease [Caldilinea sp.]|uniref:ABC transporter permease n=1 Tax=Caldilinea sp. TaxID=2293560 RepID=UPI002C0D6346|nr:ABC transporter permease [Caldilinea sp.]
MAWTKLWVIAYRDLIRNRRRTFFTLLAVALGLALLIVVNGFIAGVVEDSLQNGIRLQTGHVQLRAESYTDGKHSLQWADLLDQPEARTAQAAALPEVTAAGPLLWADAIMNTREDSVGLLLYGIDPASSLHTPIRDALVAGAFIEANDRSGIVMGKTLADNLGLKVGENVNLTVINASGQPEEALFVIRGLFASGVPIYDQSAIFMPLAKAQAFTQAGDRASAIMIMLTDQEDADAVAAALSSPGVQTLTWRDLNAYLLETMGTAMSFYVIIDAIIMLIVAVIVANTLLMAVFERIREMGILAALGMKRRQITQMMIFEAAIIALAGVVVGGLLGSLAVLYLTQNGFFYGDNAAVVGNMAVSAVLYARFEPVTFTWLAVWTLIIALLASLYPAWFAARLEPVDALHSS